MKKVAITGFPGSGKSTVLDMFARLGSYTLSADAICHQLLLPCNEGYHKVVSAFGKACIDKDGEINRDFLRSRLFTDKQFKRRLESILHPLIKREVLHQIEKVNDFNPQAIIVAEIPLLFEVGWQDMFDWVVLVEAPWHVCLKRLQKRGLSYSEAIALMALQWPLKKKRQLANIVINASGTLEDTFKQVKKALVFIEKSDLSH